MRQHGWARWAGWARMVGTAAGLGLALILGTATRVVAHPPGPGGNPSVIHACVRNTGVLRVVGAGEACSNNESPIHWNAGRLINLGLTVFDTQTGLEWEKKTTAVGSEVNATDLHDVDNTYTWCVATGDAASTPCAGNTESWIAAVNAEGFAGRTDWRVPSLAELQSIVDPYVAGCGSGTTPCIDPIFGPTQAGTYWSSTELGPSFAWEVTFFSGVAESLNKPALVYVRAVRGGP